VISGIIHMLKCGGPWQDVPTAYGPPTTVYDRLDPVEPSWCLGTHPRGHDRGSVDRRGGPDRQQLHQGPSLRRWRKRGVRSQAIGISRGGRTTKIRALVDVLGRPLRLILTPGNASDVKATEPLVEDAGRMKRLVAAERVDAILTRNGVKFRHKLDRNGRIILDNECLSWQQRKYPGVDYWRIERLLRV
jgi:transposase